MTLCVTAVAVVHEEDIVGDQVGVDLEMAELVGGDGFTLGAEQHRRGVDRAQLAESFAVETSHG
ncbi:hypothetical protein DRQ25_05160 [Candidatus Fermentibacteria bacterium]|nr:MAG: hypothetical protein DRQ25_05160 [Candidatus Fermentibacteria bacterium]